MDKLSIIDDQSDIRKLLEEIYGSTGLTGFIPSLPTSSPHSQDPLHCADCTSIKQTENYAADLAELFDRCRELEQKRSMNDGQAVNC